MNKLLAAATLNDPASTINALSVTADIRVATEDPVELQRRLAEARLIMKFYRYNP